MELNCILKMATIKRFGVIRLASFLGLYGVAIGLFAGILFSLLSLFIPAESIAGVEPSLGIINLFSFGSLIVLPIFYGIMFFVMGFIFTPIINLILKVIKGIDLDIDLKK